MPTLARASLSEDERRVLERFTDRLREELGADLHAVWLYGSRARGERTGPESDVDVLVVTAGGRERDGDIVWHALREAAEEVGAHSWGFMPQVWDRDRLRQRREIQSFFIQEVDRDKIVLAGDS
jgi:predicted nucleotidyltransferase